LLYWVWFFMNRRRNTLYCCINFDFSWTVDATLLLYLLLSSAYLTTQLTTSNGTRKMGHTKKQKKKNKTQQWETLLRERKQNLFIKPLGIYRMFYKEDHKSRIIVINKIQHSLEGRHHASYTMVIKLLFRHSCNRELIHYKTLSLILNNFY
jgi:hypothetical protein